MTKEYLENNVGIEGARMLGEALKTNTTLTTLDLSSEESTEKKSDNDIYKRLNFNNKDNFIGDEGARLLSDGLRKNTALTKLNLRSLE